MTTSDDLAQPPLPPGSGVGSPVKIEPNYIPHPKDTLKSKGSAPSASSSPSSSQPSSSAASTATTPSTIPSAKATKPKPRYTGSDVDVNAQPLLSAGPVLVPIKKFDNDSTNGRWSKEEDALLRLAVDKLGAKNWKRVSAEFLKGTRTDVQCLHRWQKVLKPGLVKGPWTKEEDDTIINCRKRGITKWSEIAQHVTGRIGKQCRERWFNHLDPDIRRCEWTEEEDRKLIEGQALLGNKWTQIAKLFLPGRPENAVKNRWNAATRRRIGTKKKLQIENINKVGAQSNGGVNKKPQVKKKMRPYTKTQARFRQIRPTQDFKDLGNAMDAMVDMAMTGFKYIPEEEEEDKSVRMKRPSRKRKNSSMRKGKRAKESVDTAVDMLSSLIDGGAKKSKSFQESRPGLSRPAALNIKNEGEEDNLKTPRKKGLPVDIALSPTKSKATDGPRNLGTSTTSGKEEKDKKKSKLKEYFKSEEIVQLNENVPQLVI